MEVLVLDPSQSLVYTEGLFCLQKNPVQNEKYPLAQLHKVSILTTESRPMRDDLGVGLFFAAVVLVLPSQHPSYEGIYSALTAALRIDYKEVIKAMRCTENAEFVIWNKEG